MNGEISVPVSFLTKTAKFAQEATPVLEKVAVDQQALAASAPAIVDQMIKAGCLKKESRDNAINNLVGGGMTKAAELMMYLAGRVTVPTMGGPAGGDNGHVKRAGYADPKPAMKESDRVWQEGMTG